MGILDSLNRGSSFGVVGRSALTGGGSGHSPTNSSGGAPTLSPGGSGLDYNPPTNDNGIPVPRIPQTPPSVGSPGSVAGSMVGHAIAAQASPTITIPDYSGLAGLQAVYNSQYAPEIAGYQSLAAQLQARAGTAWANIGAQQAALQAGTEAQRGQSFLGDMGGAIDKAAALRQIALADKYRQNAWNQAAITQGGYDRVTGEAIAARDLEHHQISLQQKAASLKSDYDQWTGYQEASARGANVSTGLVKYEKNLRDLLGNDLAQLTLADKQSGQKLSATSAANHQAKLLLAQDLAKSDLDIGEQKAKLNDRLKQLDLEAASRGLDRNKLAADLKAAIANLNLQGTLTVGQLLDQATQNRINAASTQRQANQEFAAAAANYQPPNVTVPKVPLANLFGVGSAAGNVRTGQPLPPTADPAQRKANPNTGQPMWGIDEPAPGLGGQITFRQIADNGKLGTQVPGIPGLTYAQLLFGTYNPQPTTTPTGQVRRPTKVVN